MRSVFVLLGLIALMFVGVVSIAAVVGGCAAVNSALNDTESEALVLVNETEAAVADLKSEVSELEPGSKERVEKEALLAQVEDVLKQAKVKLAEAKQLREGKVPDSIGSAVSGLPYGPLILLGISLITNLVQNGKVAKYKTGFTKVVESWKKVGEELSAGDKSKVAAIQGPAVTALVHATKVNL